MNNINIETDDGSIDRSAVTPLAVDPLADLLFNLVAIIVIAVIVILPTVDITRKVRTPTSVEFKIDGRTAKTLVATSEGIRSGAGASEFVALNHILDDEQFAMRLDRMRNRNDVLLVLIEPDGLEAAFLFESVASVHGPAQFRQVRLDFACTYARSAHGAEICPEQSGWDRNSGR